MGVTRPHSGPREPTIPRRGLVWGVAALAPWVAEWQEQGGSVLETRLWLLSLGVWLALSFLALFGVVQQGFDARARYLATLPVEPGSRFRGLYTLLVVEHLASWLLVVAVTFLAVLRAAGLPWLALLLAGQFAGLFLLLAALLAMLHIGVARALAAGASVLIVLGVALALAWRYVSGHAPIASVPPLPVAALLMLGTTLGLAWLSAPLGRLYLAAFSTVEGRNRAGRVRLLSGINLLAAWLASRASLTAALLYREVLSRSRAPLTWLRLLTLPLYLAIVLYLHARDIPAGVPDLLWLAGGSGVLLYLMILDSQPSPLGGEGNRLALFLVAPLSRGRILRARWLASFWTSLPAALGLAGSLGWGLGAGPVELLYGGPVPFYS